VGGCGFKAALPRQKTKVLRILSNVAVRSYDGAPRLVYGSGWRGRGRFPDTYAVVMVPGTLELNMTQRTQRNVSPAFIICVGRIAVLERHSVPS
jgi:hypothetical protein